MLQSQALDVLRLGHNVYLTGAAGAGKTYVLNKFVKHLKQNKIGVAITASTGIAATHLNGMTIHSWAGIGIKDSLDDAMLDRMLQKSQLKNRFEKTKVLIIDEVSMLHGHRLDMVDQVARAFKDDQKPFGGLQVVLSGDLFQLPPISRDEEPDFVFESQAWREMSLKICYLSEQHRQDDGQLLDLLNAIRNASVDDDFHGNLLRDRMQASTSKTDSITKLYSHNEDVNRINTDRLNKIDSKSKFYQMSSNGSKRRVEMLITSCLAPEVLELKLGAEVMFVANNPKEGFYNGTRGTVVAFNEDDEPVISTVDEKVVTPSRHSWQLMEGDKVKADITQFPLRHAWAITVHKSQGMTLDAAEVDLSKAFEPGMGYVALSRVRSLDGLYLLGANSRALEISPKIMRFDQRLRSQSLQVVQALDNLPSDKAKANQQKVVSLLSEKPIDDEDIEYDESMYAKLKAWRAELAKKDSVPSYVIFHDRTLKLIAALKPTNKQELSVIKGVGAVKLEKYGEEVLRVVGSKK